MQVQLSWNDPTTQIQQQTICLLPVALGRRLKGMPPNIDGKPLSRVVLDNEEISRLHAVITLNENQVAIVDRSTNGTIHNGRLLHQACAPLSNGDIIHVGPYEMTVTLLSPASLESDQNAAPAHSETLPLLDPSSLNVCTDRRNSLSVNPWRKLLHSLVITCSTLHY